MKRLSLVASLLAVTALHGMANASPDQIIEPSEGREVAVPMHPTRQLVTRDATTSGVLVYEITLDARTPGTPPHSHASEDELLYVTQGEVRVQIEDTVHRVTAGSMVVKPRGQVHAFWNGSSAPARMLLVVTGGGDFEGFFNSVEAAAAELANPDAVQARMDTLAADAGITLAMDQLAAEAVEIYAPQ